MNDYQINEDALNIVKFYEGCRLTAYLCPALILTIGYGSTGKHVTEGLKITQQEAEALLKKDLKRFEEGVKSYLKVPVSHNAYSALVSFTFNVGLGNLKESTLLKLINTNNQFKEAAEEFKKWDKAGGKVLAGLTKRRAAERELFLNPGRKEKIEAIMK